MDFMRGAATDPRSQFYRRQSVLRGRSRYIELTPAGVVYRCYANRKRRIRQLYPYGRGYLSDQGYVLILPRHLKLPEGI